MKALDRFKSLWAYLYSPHVRRSTAEGDTHVRARIDQGGPGLQTEIVRGHGRVLAFVEHPVQFIARLALSFFTIHNPACDSTKNQHGGPNLEEMRLAYLDGHVWIGEQSQRQG